MTLHLVGFPHTRLDGGFETCAYTQKVAKFRKMDVGRDLVVYGAEGADVVLLNEFERRSLFGQDDPTRPPEWPTEEQWYIFNARAIAAIANRAKDGDLLLLAGGWSQRVLPAVLSKMVACEPFVGYEGIATDFCAFESAAHRHFVYGRKSVSEQAFNGRWMDTVIPNFFDVADFPHVNAGGGDYLLYVGRMVARKGIGVAAQIAEAAGMRIVFAGPGVAATTEGEILTSDGTLLRGDVHYAGVLDAPARAELMAGARALLAPTLYIEPFGGVAVEAMLCGTPVIASDYGAFTETIEQGRNGFRFKTLRQGVEAVAKLDELAPPHEIAVQAIMRYSLEAVAPLFAEWFGILETIPQGGWSLLGEPATIVEIEREPEEETDVRV